LDCPFCLNFILKQQKNKALYTNKVKNVKKSLILLFAKTQIADILKIKKVTIGEIFKEGGILR